MAKFARAGILALVATVAGFFLQCASDPQVIGDGGLVDGWMADLGMTSDSIGPKADAAPTAPDSFTMTFNRENGTPDTLLREGSQVEATVDYAFKGNALVPAVTSLNFRVFNASTQNRIRVDMSFARATSGSMAIELLDSLSIEAYKHKVNGNSKVDETSFLGRYGAGQQSGDKISNFAMNFTTVGFSKVAGTYSMRIVDSTSGKIRDLSGSFEVQPKAIEAGELKP